MITKGLQWRMSVLRSRRRSGGKLSGSNAKLKKGKGQRGKSKSAKTKIGRSVIRCIINNIFIDQGIGEYSYMYDCEENTIMAVESTSY